MSGKEFQGVLYDLVDDFIYERAPVLRGTREEAQQDALQLVAVWNADEGNREVREACEADACVMADGVVEV